MKCPLRFWCVVMVAAALAASCKPPQKVSVSVDASDENNDLAASWETPGASNGQPQESAGIAAPDKPAYRRSDAALLERFEGKPMAEILGELSPAPKAGEEAGAAATDTGAVHTIESELFHTVPVAGLGGEMRGASVAVADLNGDLFTDIVALDAGGNLRFYLGGESASPSGTVAFARKLDGVGRHGADGNGFSVVDFDGDGLSDVMLYRLGGMPSSLLRNTGDAVFEDVTSDLGVLDFRDSAQGLWADFTGDGRLDLLLVNRGGNERCGFYVANGKGGFDERSEAWGLSGSGGGVRNAAVLDVDGDGWLDVVIAGESSGRSSAVGWYWNRQGRGFRRSTPTAGMPGVGLRVADLDGDGRVDLLAADGENWQWWRNVAEEGDKTEGAARLDFENVSDVSGLADLNLSAVDDVLVEDFDGDGDLDLLAAGSGRLLLNRRGDRFVESSPANPGGEGSRWLACDDFDSDVRYRRAWPETGVAEPCERAFRFAAAEGATGHGRRGLRRHLARRIVDSRFDPPPPGSGRDRFSGDRSRRGADDSAGRGAAAGGREGGSGRKGCDAGEYISAA